MAVSYEPIQCVQSQGLGMPGFIRQAEAASKTFNKGVPCMLDGSGNIVECTFVAADIIYGINAEKPHNLAVANTAQQLSEETPQNQASAVITPVGAWVRDGKIGLYKANSDNVFSIMLKDGQVFTQALILSGTLYGLTKDSTTGFWYLDNTDTSGNNAVAELVALDSSSPNTAAGGARVFFRVAASKRYFD